MVTAIILVLHKYCVLFHGFSDTLNQRINYTSAIFIVGYWMRALFGIVFNFVHVMFSIQCVSHTISFLVVSSPFELSFYHSNILYVP